MKDPVKISGTNHQNIAKQVRINQEEIYGNPGLRPFILTIDWTDTFTLPLVSYGKYDFSVDWGDGNSDRITAWDQAEKTHNYASSGEEYTIKRVSELGDLTRTKIICRSNEKPGDEDREVTREFCFNCHQNYLVRKSRSK